MSLSPIESDAIRRRVAGWRAAEAREIQHRRGEEPVTPDQALSFAFEARALNPEAFERADPLREREVLAVQATWNKLRERLGWRSVARR